MNRNLGFKIEACLTPIARDLLPSLAGQQAQHSTRCMQFVLLHQVVKSLTYVRWKSAPYYMLRDIDVPSC